MGHFWLEYNMHGQQQRSDFTQAQISIGRDAASDFHLDHPTVSRQHALIVENYGQFQLVVLSKNGLTAVDGQVVSGTVDLQPGMTIQVGEVQLGFRAGVPMNGGVGEVATQAVNLDSINPMGPTMGMQAVDEQTDPSQDAWNQAPAWQPSNPPPPQGGFGSPGGSGFGSPGGSGFGQMSLHPGGGVSDEATAFNPIQSSAPTPPAPMPATPAPAPKKDDDDDFKIKSWEEIAAEAATGAHGAVSGPTDFERIQKAQAKASKKQGTNPMLLTLVLLAVGGVIMLQFYEKPKPVQQKLSAPERCEGLKICYPVEAEPKCETPTDCRQKALQAYNVADELSKKKEANITNRYEAYKQLDKAARFMAQGGIETPPPAMKDFEQRLVEAEGELDKIASEHRIRQHKLQQRKMSWDQAENVRAWQAYFPDSYNTWYQEAIDVERTMKDRGTWPKRFDPKPTIKKR